MKTATTNRIEWVAEVNAASKIVSYKASGPGFDAIIFTRPFGVPGWHASVELSSRSTMTTLGKPSSHACKAWVRRVVNEYS